ncbi:MAG TPA: BMP family ABC transporter substrate-binding protein [Clostridia bacterium]|jgi:basic membrane protein A|nr:BMP family ABC transporter substrate-binding protein [Clostridia bacterium]
MKRILALLLILSLVLGLVMGCGQSVDEEEPKVENEATAEVPEEEKLRVALALAGPVNDMGWNASAFEGLKEAEKLFDIEATYQENVQQSDMEEVFRNYALAGYNLIIGHGFQFGDALMKVSEEFPDLKFVVTSSDISKAPNLASVNLDNEQKGFLAGAVAALLTKTNTVGYIGGQEIPPIKGTAIGFEAGAKYINPDIKVLSTFTGSFEDVNKAKEVALAMISENADVIMANANQAGLGPIEACQEKGVLSIGSNQDQNEIAPDTVVTSAIQSSPILIKFLVEKVQKGEFEPKFYNLGVAEGAVYLAPWHGFEDKIPQEVKDKVEEITEGLRAGQIEYK